MNWIYSISGENYKGSGSIGDWLGFQGTGNQLMSDVYYAYDALLMSDMAKAVNKEDDVKKYEILFKKIKNAFIDRYISHDKNGAIIVKSSIIEDPNDIFEDGISVYRSVKEENTQSALLWCLKLGLYKDDSQRQQLIDLLAENIKNKPAFKSSHPNSTRNHYAENTLSIGFLGVPAGLFSNNTSLYVRVLALLNPELPDRLDQGSPRYRCRLQYDTALHPVIRFRSMPSQPCRLKIMR